MSDPELNPGLNHIESSDKKTVVSPDESICTFLADAITNNNPEQYVEFFDREARRLYGLYCDREDELKELESNPGTPAEELKSLKATVNRLEKIYQDYELRRDAVEKFGFPVNRAVSLFLWNEKLDYNERDMWNDVENNVCVMLQEHSDLDENKSLFNRSSAIYIKRGKNTTEKFFIYEDFLDHRNDNPTLNFQRIDNVQVFGDKVKVTLVRQNGSKMVQEFNIAYEEEEPFKRDESGILIIPE